MTNNQSVYNTSYGDPSDFHWERFWQLLEADYPSPILTHYSVETEVDITKIDFGMPIDFDSKSVDVTGKWNSGVFRVGNAVIGYRYIEAMSRIYLRILSAEEELNSTLLDVLKTALIPVPRKENQLRVRFWNLAPTGPNYSIRNLDAPEWADIAQNYPTSVRDDLDRFVNLKSSDITGGRLSILHGPPGTGKTTFIRALCKSWSKWCSIDYIIDPERFFGDSSYMIAALSAASHDESSLQPSMVGFADEDKDCDCEDCRMFMDMGEATASKHTPWRLLIIEDAEEFLTPDAKDHVGQALSRLLNIGDGFIGQGLNVMVLMTTNRKMSDVHEAIKRPGRCMVNTEVPLMSAEEASVWLGKPTTKGTLAELFERKRESGQIGNGVPQVTGTGQYL